MGVRDATVVAHRSFLEIVRMNSAGDTSLGRLLPYDLDVQTPVLRVFTLLAIGF